MLQVRSGIATQALVLTMQTPGNTSPRMIKRYYHYVEKEAMRRSVSDESITSLMKTGNIFIKILIDFLIVLSCFVIKNYFSQIFIEQQSLLY